MSDQLISLLQQWRPISPEEAELIAAGFETNVFEEGEYLFRGGRVIRQLFFVCDGVLRITRSSEVGTEVTVFFIKENQFCSILNSFINEVPAPECIQAACKTTVLSIEKSSLKELYKKLSWLPLLLDRVLQQHLLDKIALQNTYLGLDSTERYKLFLVQQPEIARRVPLSHIASYLRITPQSLSRVRRNIR
jgi:CRP-like cAMP-binding protein